ncbi:MAG: 16S rRNA (cytosine(967)-C(5))-methyltransferase RsmB [Ruminococcaceae bacterium]|nr:16S rRNA (cytosine(967)-C(5))-methyltransferase RsmB [Oscillospiraceae bacterium]
MKNKNIDASKKSVTSPRLLALDVLIRVEGGQYANIALDTALGRHELSPEDKALFTSLVYGVLERRVTLDFILSQFSARKLSDVDAQTLCALRMGLYQLVYLDRVPDFAAINESVAVALRKSSGFVNAVLRAYLRSVEGKKRETHFTPADFADRYSALADKPNLARSVAYGLPLPLAEKFIAAFGEEKAERVMAAFAQRPPITLRVNTLRTTVGAVKNSLSKQGFSVSDGLYLDSTLRLDKGGVFDGDEFKNGHIFVQDEASQLCVEVLGAQAGELVIDTCSCPGSKAFGCAIRMENSGEIFSFDLHESKLSLVQKGAKRLGIDIIKTQRRDARDPDKSLIEKADRVLCDVPCSGLGVISKKPEIRGKDLTEAAKLPAIQREILEQSAKYLKRGGVLVYSTCTLLPEENGAVVSDFLKNHPEFCAVDFEFSPRRQGLSAIRSERGCITLTPDEYGTDGFFIAKLKRL